MGKQLITLNESGMVTPLSDSIRKQMEGVSRVATTPLVPPPSAGSSAMLGVGGIEPLDPKIAQMIPNTFTQSMLIGGDAARFAMFPDEAPEQSRPNHVVRAMRGIANGIAQMIPASLTLAGGIVDFMDGENGTAGNAIAREGMDIQTWLNEHVAVENPTFYDAFWNGVGSLASFLLPGMGAGALATRVAAGAGMIAKTAEGAVILSKAGKTFQALTGAGLMSFLEAGVEQSQRQQELMATGLSADEALRQSAPIFWYNTGVLMATNIAEFYVPMPASIKGEFTRRVASAVRSAFVEGGQERVQSVIQDVVAGRGEWGDFFANKYWQETGVGALTGGLGGAIMPEGANDANVVIKKAPPKPAAAPTPAPVASGQSGPSGGTPPPAPPAGGQPAAPAPAPVAPAAVPDGMESPPSGFDVYSDEPAAPLAQTPAQQETPPEVAPANKPKRKKKAAQAPEPIPTPATESNPNPTREIVNHFINEQDGTVSEVIKEPDGTFSVDTTDSESGDRIELRKRFPTQDAADVHARLMTGQQEQAAPEAAPQDAPIPNDVQLTSRNRLANPIKGKTGASIVGYQWMSTTEEGMFRDRKVSDWTRSQKSEPTGRDIVHVFFVQTEDGSIKVMGVGAAQKALGISTDRLYSIAKSEQQMARQRIENRDNEEVRILEKVASETPTEAARRWRTSNGAKGDITKTVLMTKNGKFFRTADANLQESLSERGWSVADSDPVDALREQEAVASPAAETSVPPAPAAVEETDLVQRIEEPGVERASTSKPHGIYTTPANVESPHKGLGGKRYLWRKNKGAKVLDVSDAQGKDTAMRKGAIDSGAGVGAVRKLLGDGQFQLMRKMSKADLIKYAKGLGVEADLSGYYDAQEVMEAIGADLARKAGYDAISYTDTGSPQFSEYVALTDNAMTPVDDGAREKQQETPPPVEQPAPHAPSQVSQPQQESDSGYTPEEEAALKERFKNNSDDEIAIVGDVISYVDTVDGTPISDFDLTSEQVTELAKDANAVMEMADKGQVKLARKAGKSVAAKLEKMVRATRAAEQTRTPPPEPAPAAEPAGSPVGAAEGEAAPAASANIVALPTSQLHVDPTVFQARKNVTNPKSGTNEAKMKRIMAKFKASKLNVIVAWLDPADGRLKVLDGHHTLEAAKRGGVDVVDVRIFDGTKEEAIQESKNLNDERDANDDLARAGNIRNMREQGAKVGDIQDEAQRLYGRNASTIIALSHLNPNGRVMAALESFMASDERSDTSEIINKIAKWIGEARRRNPSLTDAHEGQMLDTLMKEYNDRSWSKTEAGFLKHVKGIVSAEGFDPNAAINLYLDKRSPAERSYDAELEAAEKALSDAEQALSDKRDELNGLRAKVGKNGRVVKDSNGNVVKERTGKDPIAPEIQKGILAKMQQAVDVARADRDAVLGRRDAVMEAEQNQGGLFRVSGKSPSYASLNKSAAARGLTPAVKAEARDTIDEMAARVAKMFGFKNVEFVRGLRRSDGKLAHGYYQSSTDTVFLNIESEEPLLTVLMHEVGHRMKARHPDLWAELQGILNSQASERGKRIYTNDAIANRGYDPSQVEDEWVDDGLMEASTSPLFWNEIKVRNPHLAGKLIDMIVDALRAIRKMFARSGASVDVYYKNFNAITMQVGKVAAEMVAREEANQLRPKVDPAQQSLFRVARGGKKVSIATMFSGMGTVEAALRGAYGAIAVEFDKAIVAAHNAAHGTAHAVKSVLDFTVEDFIKSGAKHLHASPICKNFSKAKRVVLTEEQIQDRAYAEATAKIISSGKPETITIENVQEYEDTPPYKIITDALKQGGYEWRVVRHDAADYGAAQTRKRLIIQAVKKGKSLPPLPAMREAADWYETIKDLIDAEPRITSEELNATARKGDTHWELARIKDMIDRGLLDGTKPILTMGGSASSGVAYAASAGGPAPTLKSSPGEVPRILFPDGTLVRVTPRMMARLMGLSDDLVIPEKGPDAKKVLGNGIHASITEAFIQPLVDMSAEDQQGPSPESVDDIGAFRIAPASSPEMQERIDTRNAALSRARQARQHSIWGSGFWRVVYKNMLDKNTAQYAAEKRAQKSKGFKREFAKSPYIAMRLLRTWVSNANIDLEYGVFSWDGKTKMAPALREIIKKYNIAADIDSGEMGTFWMAATLVSRRWAIGDRFFGDDPTSQQYQEASDEYQKWQDLYDKYKGNANWVAAVDELTAWAYARVERAYQSGAISAEDRDNLKGKYGVYAPLMRIEEGGYNISKGDIVGAGRLAHEMKRFDPTAIYMDPFDAAIKQTYGMEFFSKNSEARRSLADFITEHRDKPRGAVSLDGVGYRVKPKTNPVYLKIADMLKAAGFTDAEIQSIDKWIGGHGPKVVNGVDIRSVESAAKMYVTSTFQEDGVIALMRDGEVEYWKLEPEIYEAWVGTSGKETSKLMKYFTMQSSMLRAGAILTPDFIVKNPLRDMMSAGILANSMVNNPKDALLLPFRIASGISSAYKKDARWLEFFSNAGNGNLVSKDQGELPKATRELTSSKFKYVVHGHPLNLLRAISNITEEGTRTAVFAKTKADLMGKGLSEAEASVRAAIEASEASVDFSRSGRYGEVINRIIPFFNANLQDNDKLFRAAFVDDGKSKVWMRGIIMLSMPSIALWLINHDDDWYKEQPVWVKNNFWLFSLDGGKTIHKLVKPFGVGLTFASLPERVLDWHQDNDPEAMKEWALAEVKNFFVINDKNPIASGSALLGPMGSTLQEIGSNYDAYKGAPIVKGWLEEVEPREQYTASTSEFAKWAGGMAPGGGLSPMMIDHFIRGSFGGLGVYGAQIASEAIMLADPKRRALKPSSRLVYDEIPDWIPIIRSSFITRPATYTRQMQEFFEVYDSSREAVKTLQALSGSGAGPEKVKQLYRRSGADIVMAKPAMATAKAMGEASKQIRAIESAPESVLTRDQKREKIDKLIQMRNTYAEKFMEQYHAVDLVALQKQINGSFPDEKKGR